MYKAPETKLLVERIEMLNAMDLSDITDITVATMEYTKGFNIGTQLTDYGKLSVIQSYWEGVLLVPEIELFVGRMDGVIAGTLQLVKPSPSNQTSHFACVINNFFIAPWARGFGLSEMMMDAAEKEAKMLGFSLIKVSVRETREAALKVFERRGYVRWGVLPKYELDGGKIVPGIFYYKEI
ncbi:MAG: GNAT family N-acetyltransferase [Alphaproteobacteria bacterium]|jgi:ribosomal protein S18 acetylase RimI-like enzyme